MSAPTSDLLEALISALTLGVAAISGGLLGWAARGHVAARRRRIERLEDEMDILRSEVDAIRSNLSR